MSDKGEKTCPLCAEEMDLTDQQLNPCKCGYDICVWCWHHIMDMAEKDGSEGRCPACRVPYDKEKIVGMAANCGRVVAEISNGRKVKSQKNKGKPSEGRKHLSSVRVVQRNLVYVVGLPLNLGDEDLLQHKDYFGRYGKVLKVSMSRTSTGAIQQFPNNTCSVYITYSKEEEAARCIQAVHGFALEGRPLRACFGTTKYCHAWLRNMPCSNPDCLYLHEFGSEVDSFTKDEVVPAHTRVQEITGATTNLLFRSGNVLPPPLDENASSCTVPPEKPGSSIVSSAYPSLPSSANPVKGSPPNSSSGRPASLPSASSWGARASSSKPSLTCSSTFDAPGKQKANATGVPMAFSTVVASTPPKNALRSDSRKNVIIQDEYPRTQPIEKLDSLRKKHDRSELDISTPNQNDNSDASFSEPLKQAADGIILMKSEVIVPVKSAWDDDSTDDDLNTNDKSDGYISISDVHHGADPVSDRYPDYDEQLSEDSLKETMYSKESNQLNLSDSPAMELDYDSRLSRTSHASSITYPEIDEDVRSFNIQRLSDSQVGTRPPHLLKEAVSLNESNHARKPPIHMENVSGSILMNGNFSSMCMSPHGDSQHASSTEVMSNRYHNYLTGENGCLFPDAADNQINGSESHVYNATDLGENSIISEILSMDLESDSSLAAQNLARLFSDIDKPNGSQLLSTSWNAQSKNNNQSRFSFARPEKLSFQTCVESSNPNFSQHYFSNNIIESTNQYLDQVGHNSIGFNNFEDYSIASRNRADIASNRSSASRASPVSAPPGFSIPSRAVPPPPPGFTSFERTGHAFNTQPGHSVNHPLFRSPSEGAPNGNMDINGDIEFMDPAILAVGKGRLPINGSNNYDAGMRSNFHSELDGFGDEARLKLLMQKSLTPQRALPNGFSFPNDVYGGYAQNVGQQQNQGNMYSQFVQNSQPRNGQQHHEGWRDMNSQHSNDITMLDLIMNERLGLNFNKNYNNGFEEAAFRMPSSADLYNRSLGM